MNRHTGTWHINNWPTGWLAQSSFTPFIPLRSAEPTLYATCTTVIGAVQLRNQGVSFWGWSSLSTPCWHRDCIAATYLTSWLLMEYICHFTAIACRSTSNIVYQFRLYYVVWIPRAGGERFTHSYNRFGNSDHIITNIHWCLGRNNNGPKLTLN